MPSQVCRHAVRSYAGGGKLSESISRYSATGVQQVSTESLPLHARLASASTSVSPASRQPRRHGARLRVARPRKMVVETCTTCGSRCCGGLPIAPVVRRGGNASDDSSRNYRFRRNRGGQGFRDVRGVRQGCSRGRDCRTGVARGAGASEGADGEAAVPGRGTTGISPHRHSPGGSSTACRWNVHVGMGRLPHSFRDPVRRVRTRGTSTEILAARCSQDLVTSNSVNAAGA